MADFPVVNFAQYQWEVNDQNYLTKWNNFQTAVTALQNSINTFGTESEQELADALQAAEDTRQQAITDTNAIKSQTALIRYATDQIKTDTAQIQTATQSIYDNEVIPARNATQGYRDEAETIRDQTQAISESGLPTQASNAGKSLITNGETTYWGVSVVNWISKTAAYNAEAGDKILADTSAGAFAIALPDNPTEGASVLFADPGSNWAANNLTVKGNGKNIDGAATFAADVNQGHFATVYNGVQWVIRFAGGAA